jgi:hypothetical protein
MTINLSEFIEIFSFSMQKSFKKLTFSDKKCILISNAKTFCFNSKTNQMVEVEEVKEECLKSKMAEKYDLNITMRVCQIEKWHKYINYWFLMIMIIGKREVI